MPTPVLVSGPHHRVKSVAGGGIAEVLVETGGTVDFPLTASRYWWRISQSATLGSNAYVALRRADNSSDFSCVSLYFVVDTLPSAGTVAILATGTRESDDLAQVKLTSGGVLSLVTTANGDPQTGPTISAGTLYRLELARDTSDGVNRIARMRLYNGTTEAQIGSEIVSQTAGAAFTFNIDCILQCYGSDSPTSGGTVIRFRDVVMSQTSTDFPIGAHTCKGYFVNAVGTHNLDATPSQHFYQHDNTTKTMLTTAESTSYTRIDEAPLDGGVDRVAVESVTSGFNTPSFIGVGTASFTASNVQASTNLTPTKHASTANGDLLVLVTESRGIGASCATPSGWALVNGFPKTSGTASGGKIYVFVRIADGTSADNPTVAWTSLTTGTSGDSAGARTLTFRDATVVEDGSTVAVNDLSATTTITIPTHTTSQDKSLVIGVAMRVNDTAHTFTTATWTERSDDHTTSGTGHGTTVATLVKTPAGASGTAAVTPSNTTSSRTLAVSFAVQATPVVTQPANTRYAEWTLEDSAETSDPWAVQVYAALRNESGTATNSAVVKIAEGGSEATVWSGSIGSASLVYESAILTSKPSTGAWTDATFDSTTVRFGYTADADPAPRLDALVVEAVFPVSSGLTSVSQTLTVQAQIIARVSQTRTLQNSVRAIVAQTRALQAQVKQIVSNTRTLQNAVNARTSKTLELRYLESGKVSATRALQATVRTAVSQTRQLQSTIRTAVSQTRTLPNILLNSVAGTRTLQAQVFARAVQTRALQWGIAGKVAQTRTLLNAVNARVSQTRVLQAIVNARTSATRVLQAQIVGRINRTRVLQWLIAGKVSQTRAIQYAVPGRVNQTRVIQYTVIQVGKVSQTRALQYTVNQTVSQTRALQSQVKATVARERVLQYTLNQKASQTRTLQHAVNSRTSQTRVLQAQVNARTSQTRVFMNIVNARAAQTRELRYGVQARVEQTRELRYGIEQIGRVSSTRAVQYVIRTRANQSLVVEWDVRTDPPPTGSIVGRTGMAGLRGKAVSAGLHGGTVNTHG